MPRLVGIFCNFVNVSISKKTYVFTCTIITFGHFMQSSPLPKDALCKVFFILIGRKVLEKVFNFVNVFSVPFEKVVVLHMSFTQGLFVPSLIEITSCFLEVCPSIFLYKPRMLCAEPNSSWPDVSKELKDKNKWTLLIN